MATKAIIEREDKRERLIERDKQKRAEIKEKLRHLYVKLEDENSDVDAVLDEIEELQEKLDKMPRNSSQKRRRNRCQLSGRPRGVYRRFKLCRNMIRKLAMMGMIPGIRKSSW